MTQHLAASAALSVQNSLRISEALNTISGCYLAGAQLAGPHSIRTSGLMSGPPVCAGAVRIQ